MKGKGFNFMISYVVYPFDLLVSVNEPDRKIIKTLKGILPEDNHGEIEDKLISVDSNSVARTVMFSGGQTVIRFNGCPEHGLIAHETFHAVSFLLNRIGMPLISASEEAWAYLLQYIVDEITKRCPI